MVKSNYFIRSLIQFFLYLLLSAIFVKDFDVSNVFLFSIVFLLQLKYRSTLSRDLTFFMYIIWLFFYYISVFNDGFYYTAEQVFTDSNYYDYHALFLSNFDFNFILNNSNVTWQSTFVVSFYSFVYKIFGKFLLNPIIINLILVYFTFILIKVERIKKKYLRGLILLIPFLSLNVIVPGKEPITLFLMALIMNSYFHKTPYTKVNNIKRLMFYIASAINRFNSIPILLIFELQRFKKSKESAMIFSFLTFFIVYFFLGEKLSFYLDIDKFIVAQRGGTNYSGAFINILLPNNLFLFLLTIPLRLIAFLISPFPNFNVLFNFSDSNNIFFYYFTLFKFISGLGWAYFLFYIVKNRKGYSNILIFILLSISILISSVHLVEGGRYRILCDLTLFWFFAMSSNKMYINKY